jgi:hypothetical protein
LLFLQVGLQLGLLLCLLSGTQLTLLRLLFLARLFIFITARVSIVTLIVRIIFHVGRDILLGSRLFFFFARIFIYLSSRHSSKSVDFALTVRDVTLLLVVNEWTQVGG